MQLGIRTQAQEQTQLRARTATYTNYKIIWVLVGLVAALTVGFCYLITFFLRLAESHRRNGERLKDFLDVRLYEQDKNYKGS